MKRLILICLAGFAVALTVSLFLLSGCGGGGGIVRLPETGPGPSISAEFQALLSDTQRSATYVGSDKCQPCHSGAAHNNIVDNWTNTRHNQVNVGCEQCHGPASIHVAAQTAAARSPGFNTRLAGAKTRAVSDEILTYANDISHPERDITSPIVCAQCHGPTYEQWSQSPHADIVRDAVASRSSTCERCHSANTRVKLINSRLTYNGFHEQTALDIDANIVNVFKDSKQVDQLVASTQHTAVCTTCHAPHQKTKYLASNGDQRQLRMNTFNTDFKDRDETTNAFFSFGVEPEFPIVAPKFYTTFNQVCAECHNGRGANGNDAAIKVTAPPGSGQNVRPNMHDSPQFNTLVGIGGAFRAGHEPIVATGSHTDVPNQCVHCHMPNRRHTFTVSFDTSCQPCHTTSDAAVRAATIKGEILNKLSALRSRMESWALNNPDPVFSSVVDTTLRQQMWDYPALTNVETPPPPVADQRNPTDGGKVPIEIKRARHNYYFVIRDKSFGVHNPFYLRALITEANENLDAIGVSRAASRAALTGKQSLQVIQWDALRARMADRQDPHQL
jgi:hypothetical protein